MVNFLIAVGSNLPHPLAGKIRRQVFQEVIRKGLKESVLRFVSISNPLLGFLDDKGLLVVALFEVRQGFVNHRITPLVVSPLVKEGINVILGFNLIGNHTPNAHAIPPALHSIFQGADVGEFFCGVDVGSNYHVNVVFFHHFPIGCRDFLLQLRVPIGIAPGERDASLEDVGVPIHLVILG